MWFGWDEESAHGFHWERVYEKKAAMALALEINAAILDHARCTGLVV